MRAAVLNAPGRIDVEARPDPRIIKPTDALVRVTASCVCGSDLWSYRGIGSGSGPMGHEFVGVVEELGSDVSTLSVGDLVIAPFLWSCGTCRNCVAGWQSSCEVGGGYGSTDRNGDPVDGGQGEYVRVPQADGTLVASGLAEGDALTPALLTLSDVMGTGHHAALSAGAGPGTTIAVVGDGAVGLCAVLAAKRLGAERVIALSSHDDRAALATRFGATDVVAARGKDAVDQLRELTDGLGVDGTCECVGTTQAWETAIDATRPGGGIGYVGVPHGVTDGIPAGKLFRRNITVRGGVAPVRHYLPELLADVRSGALDPSPVFTLTVPLEEIDSGYRAMDAREAIKTFVQP